MTAVKDSFLDLERHRVQLEDTIKSLRKALQHWQTWDFEYEALKEELDAVPETNPSEELQRIRDGFEGELLRAEEIGDIFGGANTRSSDQIRNLLDRRIDYVTKNIETLQKQIENAENKLAAATVVSQPDSAHDDGEAVMDIVEELDDDDNVLSYRVNQPGDSIPQVQEVLKKAGAGDLEDLDAESTNQSQASTAAAAVGPVLDTAKPAPPAAAPVNHASPVTSKKGVSFAEDTKAGHEPLPQPQTSRAARRVESIMKTARDQEQISQQVAVIPDDEDPDDAALRREMLKYSMGEVGAVVAELQLEETGSDQDDDWDYMNEETDEDEDDEDQWGRSKTSVITEGYRQHMLELEKKLGIKSRLSEEEMAEMAEDSGSDNEGIGRIMVKPQTSESHAPTLSSIIESTPPAVAIQTGPKGKKGVRFAEELDIAPTVETTVAKPAPQPTEPKIEPVRETIVERTGSSKPVESKPNRKPSRFKKIREEPLSATAVPKGPFDAPPQFLNEQRHATPTGPEGVTIADELVEKETTSKPLSPDDFDDSMIHLEVADEYQRMRRKFIHRQGGFLKQEELPTEPLDESGGDPEPMSRFKSARLSRQ
ncbi:hypothetical protein S40285_04885 [Stachybotrys chlorohalonatus IBT 40285]|uniref:DUF3835 domain-containing protein n=1 Tax=Stachybotrys chlorohalonatus (strain IBT 40285) TaxID=1283841 RepID=A0A084QP60_STAC4|nr:hypothetical protein S40285_04885 [Stachybotrys chlorohalonata IBT 40285]